MLHVASPTVTSSQDVSNPDNVAFASSAPSNLDQNADVTSGGLSTTTSPTSLNAISNPAMADTLSDPSERSSLNAVQSNELNPSDSSQLSQAADSGVSSINLDAMAQYEAVVSSQPPNPASTLDVIQIPADSSSGNGDLIPSVPAVSSPANTLGSNSNDAVDNIHLLSGLDSIHPGILSGNDGFIQAISSPVKVVNTLSNLDSPQNGAVDNIHPLSSLDSTHSGILSGNDGLTPFIQAVSSSANVDNTLANLDISRNAAVDNAHLLGGLDSIHSGILSGNDGFIQAISSPAEVGNTLSNLDSPQNGAVNNIHLLSGLDSIHPGILSGNDGLTPYIQSISSPAKVGNTLANLDIPQKGAVNNILSTSGLGPLRSTSPNIAETGTIPFLAGSLRPVQATSLESSTVPTFSNQIIADPETNTATTNGNCICGSL